MDPPRSHQRGASGTARGPVASGCSTSLTSRSAAWMWSISITRMPSTMRLLPAGRARRRHDRRLEAETRRLGQPLRQVGHAPELAGQPDLADRDHVRRQRRSSRGAERSRARPRGRWRARRAGRRRPWRRRRRGCAAGCRRAAGARRGSSPPGSRPAPDVVRRGRSAGERVTSACTSASSGRRPSMVTVTQVPGTGAWWLEEQPGRVGDRRRCRRRTGRSSRPRRPGRSGSSPRAPCGSRELRSPSKCSTTSTRCSSTRGPAI